MDAIILMSYWMLFFHSWNKIIGFFPDTPSKVVPKSMRDQRSLQDDLGIHFVATLNISSKVVLYDTIEELLISNKSANFVEALPPLYRVFHPSFKELDKNQV